jgi:ketose-bisphosphate aldolase
MTTDTISLIAQAQRVNRGLGAFNVVLLEHAEAIVAGASKAGLPVVLQISQNCVRYHGSLEPLALAVLQIARTADVEVLVHLDHADDIDLVRRAVEIGIPSIMFDASTWPYKQNVELTRDVVDYCHRHGVLVEAELGAVGGKDGVHAPGVRTDPTEAAAFVAATGVDTLAVAVGTSHAMTDRVALVDTDLIASLAAGLDVPLVLHGSSGLPDHQLAAAVRAGITKVNISTHLNRLFTGAIRRTLAEEPSVVDPRRYVASGREAIAQETARLLQLLRGW